MKGLVQSSLFRHNFKKIVDISMFDVFRHTRDLVSCQTSAVETNCAQNSLDVHKNITYKMIHPLMDAIQCPQGMKCKRLSQSRFLVNFCIESEFFILFPAVIIVFFCFVFFVEWVAIKEWSEICNFRTFSVVVLQKSWYSSVLSNFVVCRIRILRVSG